MNRPFVPATPGGNCTVEQLDEVHGVMQDEQLRKLANQCAERIWRALESRKPGFRMAGLIAKYLRTVRAQVLRDAADKMCRWCAADKKLVERERGYISNYGPFDGGLIHYVGLDSDSGYAECEAAALRAQAEEGK